MHIYPHTYRAAFPDIRHFEKQAHYHNDAQRKYARIMLVFWAGLVGLTKVAKIAKLPTWKLSPTRLIVAAFLLGEITRRRRLRAEERSATQQATKFLSTEGIEVLPSGLWHGRLFSDDEDDYGIVGASGGILLVARKAWMDLRWAADRPHLVVKPQALPNAGSPKGVVTRWLRSGAAFLRTYARHTPLTRWFECGFLLSGAGVVGWGLGQCVFGLLHRRPYRQRIALQNRLWK